MSPGSGSGALWALRAALWGEVSARRVALLRILTMIVWLQDLARMAPFVSLHYEPILGSAEGWLFAWFVATLGVLLGLWARMFAALGFVVSSVFVTLDHEIYHLDYYVLLTFLYLAFIDSDRAWSVRSWLAKREGRGVPPSVWSGPVTLFSLHLATIYLNAGLAHWVLNRSWREGYALAQSLAHPHWRSAAGEWLAHLAVPTWPVDFGTMAFEILFAPLWLVALLRPPANGLRALLAGAVVAFHIGIAVFLDIGSFSHFVIALAVIFVPPAAFGETQEGALACSSGGSTFARRVTVLFLAFWLLLALLVQPPLELAARRSPLIASALAGGKSWLAAIGDARHHDVFPEAATRRVFYVVALFESGGRTEPWPLFFDEAGERVGWASDMRTFMSLRQPLRALGSAAIARRPFGIVDVERVLRFAEPLLLRDLARPRNAGVEGVLLEVRGHILGRSFGSRHVVGPFSAPLACYAVVRSPAPALAPRSCTAAGLAESP